eukprot:700282_1
MGGKHPAPGHVFIVSEHNGYVLAKNDEHEIVMSKNKVPRGAEGWRISNIPNDENIQRMGYNYVIHNKHPLRLLGCDENGHIITSERRQWDSLSGWRIVQQKDTNMFHFINHYDYWITVNDTGNIAMLKKHQLPQNAQQNWHLEYITPEDMTRKVPREAMEETQQEAKKNEEIIQNILHRTDHANMTHRNSNKSSKQTQNYSDDDGYGVDDEDDGDHKANYVLKKRKKKQQNVLNISNVYNKNEMDKKFEGLAETLGEPLRDLSSAVRLIRAELSLLKIEVKNIEQRAQMDRNKIKEQLNLLQQAMMKGGDGCCVEDKDRHDSLTPSRKKVKDWITDKVGFADYSWNFLDNGFDSLTIVKKISNPQQLSDIGITLKGHQIQIMAEILQLKHDYIN